MRRVLIIAETEFLALVRTKAFGKPPNLPELLTWIRR
jgi:hypothetical protein